MATTKPVPGRFPALASEPQNKRVVRTTDSPNCTGACGWLATVVDDVIVDLKPAADYPCAEYNPRGCLRGMSMTHLIYGPDRIKSPLIRVGERGEGKWKEATWDEALDVIAEHMKRIIRDHGADHMLLFNQVVGTGYVQKGAQVRMAALLGMSFATAYDFNGDISMGFTHTVGIDCVECETKSWSYAKTAFLWSSNVFQTRIPDAKFLTQYAKQQNDCKIYCIDPRCSQTAKGADVWVPINPGTDCALALSMCQVLIDEDLVDWEFLRTFTDCATLIRSDNGQRLRASALDLGSEDEFVVWDEATNGFFKLPMDTLALPDGLRPAFRGTRRVTIDGAEVEITPVFQLLEDVISRDEYRPENVAPITDVPADAIRDMARRFATVRPSSIIIGMGLNHRLHGDLTIRAILLFSALAGAHGKPGESVSIYSGQHHFRLDVSPWWFPEGRRPKPLPMHYFVLGKPTETINPKIKYPKDGVKALFVSHGNPLVTEWSEPMKRSIDALDLFVVLDFSMSPTCEYADVVLPCPTFWEKVELVGTSCHPYLQIQNEVVRPQYNSRTEMWIVRELVRRVDPSLLPYFDCTEWDAIEAMLAGGGKEVAEITLDQLKAGPVRLDVHDPEVGCDEQFHDLKLFPPRAYPFPEGAQREFLKTGRMEFYKEEDVFAKLGEQVPVYKPAFSHLPVEDQDLPLCIVTPHSKWRVHSTHSNNPLLLNLNRKPVVEIHPIDAALRGIHDGDEVEIFNQYGSYRLWALITESIKPGVLCTDHGWWHRYLAGGFYHSVHTHQKIKPTHENYYLPAVYAPGQHWKDTRVDIRRVG
ncbi:MAG TPA: molybdopterin-dependent oxidoreductase [Fimbriimonadaceae bacterium]|nr:molybdopterin-dependent oxidoreductase [Fimbriimonadaceae bacterium]HRJ97207.1 molybdopterin-dependent oxidoreductase [Fimbriimonadaceae bacterium]